ncbi:cupin domain-containing protein [Actinopolymorpha sp. B11F2]|uniref:cupin domain-containing protein n=1 Tax=Actinopolymorpha sp. B11F2 TaxID=3160862 RepID=UPI0032E4C076
MRIRPDELTTMTFDWGSIKWFVTPQRIDGAASSLGEVIVNPGRGHARHNHPDAEEVIYVISGEALQMVHDEEPFVIREGDAVHVPTAAYHSTLNTSWRPLRLIVTYVPGGEEQALTGAPDFGLVEPGVAPQWDRSTS